MPTLKTVNNITFFRFVSPGIWGFRGRLNCFLSLSMHLIDFAIVPAAMYHNVSCRLNSGGPEKPKLLKYKLRFATGITSHLQARSSFHPENKPRAHAGVYATTGYCCAKLIDSRKPPPLSPIYHQKASKFVFGAIWREGWVAMGAWVRAARISFPQLSRAEPRSHAEKLLVLALG